MKRIARGLGGLVFALAASTYQFERGHAIRTTAHQPEVSTLRA